MKYSRNMLRLNIIVRLSVMVLFLIALTFIISHIIRGRPFTKSIVEKELIGTWQIRPDLGEGWDDAYSFYPDGTYQYRYSQTDSFKSTLSKLGTWTIKDDALILSFSSQVVRNPVDVISMKDNHYRIKIEDYIRHTEVIDPPLEYHIPLSELNMHYDLSTSPGLFKEAPHLPVMHIGQQFWRLEPMPRPRTPEEEEIYWDAALFLDW